MKLSDFKIGFKFRFNSSHQKLIGTITYINVNLFNVKWEDINYNGYNYLDKEIIGWIDKGWVSPFVSDDIGLICKKNK